MRPGQRRSGHRRAGGPAGFRRGGRRTIAPATPPSSCSRVVATICAAYVAVAGASPIVVAHPHRPDRLRAPAHVPVAAPARTRFGSRRLAILFVGVLAALIASVASDEPGLACDPTRPGPPARRRRGRSRPELRRHVRARRSDSPTPSVARRRRSGRRTGSRPGGAARARCASPPARSRFPPTSSTRSCAQTITSVREPGAAVHVRRRRPRAGRAVVHQSGLGRAWACCSCRRSSACRRSSPRPRRSRSRCSSCAHDAAARARRSSDSPPARRDRPSSADLDAVRLTNQPAALARLLLTTAADRRAVSTPWQIAHLWFDPDTSRPARGTHAATLPDLDRDTTPRGSSPATPARQPVARREQMLIERARVLVDQTSGDPKLRAELERAERHAAASSRLAGRSRASRTAAGG